VSYGYCPNCNELDHPDNARQRRMDGDTYCGACKKRSPTKKWVTSAQIVDLFEALKKGLQR